MASVEAALDLSKMLKIYCTYREPYLILYI